MHCSLSKNNGRRICYGKFLLKRYYENKKNLLIVTHIGVRAGEARGAGAPPNFGQLGFFGQQEKIWAKPVLKTSPCLFKYFEGLKLT